MTTAERAAAADLRVDLAREPDFRLGDMDIRPSLHELIVGGERETLEHRIMQVLVALARRRGEVVSRDELVESCWEGRIVGEDAINRCISRLRRLSERDEGASFVIETIPRVGYRLKAAAAPAAPSSPPEQAGKSSPRLPVLTGLGVIGVLAIAAAVLVWRGALPGLPAGVDPREPETIAVLPFDSPAGGADAPMAEALAREVRNTLARTQGLRVIADTSSFAVAVQGMGTKEIARRLDADLLLDGSMQSSDGVVRVSTELIDARTGLQVWNRTEQGSDADLVALQEKVAAAVVTELASRLGDNRLKEPRQIERDPQAFRRVAEAMRAMQQSSNLLHSGRSDAALDAADQAEALLGQALAADPRDVPALVALAEIERNALSRRAAARTAEERQNASSVLVHRAVASDPNHSWALTALGGYELSRWNWRQADTLLRQAVTADPNDPDAHLVYAYYLIKVGRCREAVRHARAASALDPEFLWRRLVEPRVLACAGRPDEAMRLYRGHLVSNPDHVFLLKDIYIRLLQDGDAGAMRRMIDFVRREVWKGKPPSAQIEALLARMAAAADALDGRPTALHALVLADASAPPPSGRDPLQQGRQDSDRRWIMAMEFAAARDPERAVDLLQQAVTRGSLYVPDTLPYGAHEFTAAVRKHPRYTALWRSDPRLVELGRLRLKALRSGEFNGVLPDGRVVWPQGTGPNT